MTIESSIYRTAEWVLPGHPDKLCDVIADAIVMGAYELDPYSLVGIEVACHRSFVAITGRVSGDGTSQIPWEEIVRDVYRSAGYGRAFGPDPDSLRIELDIDADPLVTGEAAFRSISDDQSIVIGFWCSHVGTNGLPVEQALVRRLALGLHGLARPKGPIGPDGKVIVSLQEKSDGRYVAQRIIASIIHRRDWNAIDEVRAIRRTLLEELQHFAAEVPCFDASVEPEILVNPVGDFVCGGPLGDNGLSGKKLVVDFYGPRVPIGGGAMSGKDFWKVDRAGPLIAREVARDAALRCGLQECTATLSIAPGDRAFRIERIADERGVTIDPRRVANRIDLTLNRFANWPRGRDLLQVARWGIWEEFRPWDVADVSHAGRRRMNSVSRSFSVAPLLAKHCTRPPN